MGLFDALGERWVKVSYVGLIGAQMCWFFVAQNVPNSDWEKKVTEYFKEKLKENNATNWVRTFYSFRVAFFLKLHCTFYFMWLLFAKSCL